MSTMVLDYSFTDVEAKLDEFASRNPVFVVHINLVSSSNEIIHNKISSIFIWGKLDETLIVPINHVDSNLNPTQLKHLVWSKFLLYEKSIIFTDKKTACHAFDHEFINSRDLNIIRLLSGEQVIACSEITGKLSKHLYAKYGQCKNDLTLLPLLPSANEYKIYFELSDEFENELNNLIAGEYFYNETLIPSLYLLEKTGLAVDRNQFVSSFGDEKSNMIVNCNGADYVYTNYNIYNTTGRPTCSRNNINFVALNKSNNSRKSFIHRFSDEGVLMLFDFSAFHPMLISKLINHQFKRGEYPYKELAAHYFKTNNPSADQVKESKVITFKQIYNTIDQSLLDIPFFAKTNAFRKREYEKFKDVGYFETPLSRRKIFASQMEDASENKVFNYILQAFETEVAIKKLHKLIENFSMRHFVSVPVLYTYDSILIDVHQEEANDVRNLTESILMEDGYIVTTKIGKCLADL